MAQYIRVLTVHFDLSIRQKEIPLFRGAILKSLGDKANILYHNHSGEDTFRYSYPLIQYKCLNGTAAITCVEKGADIIGQFFSEMPEDIIIGNRKVKCEVGRIHPTRYLIQTWEGTFKYHLHRWLPLNTRNYHLYRMTEDENEHKKLLENILKANLLSMLKGLDIHIETELLVTITQLSEPYLIYNKNVGMMAFNADFISNLSIPNNLGIGKNASIGCGVVYQEREKKTKTEIENK